MILDPRKMWELRMSRPLMAAYESDYNSNDIAVWPAHGPLTGLVNGKWINIPPFDGNGVDPYMSRGLFPPGSVVRNGGSDGPVYEVVSTGGPPMGPAGYLGALAALGGATVVTGGAALGGLGAAGEGAAGAGAAGAGVDTAALNLGAGVGTIGDASAGLGLQTAALGSGSGLGSTGAYAGNAGIDAVNSGLGIAPSATTGGQAGLGLSGGVSAADVAGGMVPEFGTNAAMDAFTGTITPGELNAAAATAGGGAIGQIGTYGVPAAGAAGAGSTGSLGNVASAIKTGTSVATGLAGLAGGGGSSGSGLGGGSTTTTSSAPASSAEQQLIDLQTQLSQKQLDAINAMDPYNQELINQSLAQLKSQGAYQSAYDAAITPQQQAQAAADQFNATKQNSALQQQLLQMQVDSLKNGGAATDAQKQQISDATQSALASGTNDINTQTQRGIDMISDELANSRGLRLSDSPITGEAALLARAGNDQVTSLTKSLAANQANAVLNYPLAVQGLQSGINSNQQQVLAASQQFQDQLQQQAASNRLALTGPTNQAGLGLSGIGNTAQGIAATNLGRSTTSSVNNSLGLGATLSGIGSLFGAPAGGTSAAQGIGNAVSGLFS